MFSLVHPMVRRFTFGILLTGLMAAATFALASPAQAHNQRFTATCLTEDIPCLWNEASGGSRTIGVQPNHYLCVAVRGSDGYRIHFTAYLNGNKVGRTSDGLVVGDTRDCIWKNRGSQTRHLTVKISHTGAIPDAVYATGYTQHDCPPGRCW